MGIIGEESMLSDQRMFSGCGIVFDARRKDPKGPLVKVAHHVHGEEYVQQADAEEEVVQSSDARGI